MTRSNLFLQIILLNMVFMTSCSPFITTQPPEANLPNLASVHCEQNGGVLEFREDESGGVAGMCIFPDGSECEEWAFFRGECQSGETTRLAETRWKLLELRGQGLLSGTAITLMFQNEQVSGSAGCNWYGSTYITQSDHSFSLDEIVMTEKYCPEPAGVNEQEGQYLAALSEVRSYEVHNDELLLVAEQGSVLLRYQLMPKFEVKPADLIGKTWQLTSAPGLKGVELAQFTLNFNGTNLSGTTICRNYTGAYQAAEDRLRVVTLEMTSDVLCDEKLLLAEGDYTTLLENIEQYNLLETQLELYTIQGQKLVFESVSE